MAISYAHEPTAADAALAQRRIQNFIENLPCPECRGHSMEYISENPVDLSSSQSLQVWVWRFHNAVNKRLGKALLPFAAYSQLYLSEMCWANWTAADCGRL